MGLFPWEEGGGSAAVGSSVFWILEDLYEKLESDKKVIVGSCILTRLDPQPFVTK